MEHAVEAMGGFTPEDQFAVDGVELQAPLDQVANAVGPLMHQHVDGILIAEAIAGTNGILEVQLGAVGGAEGGGHTSLGIAGGALGGRVGLGQYRHLGARGGFYRGAEAGDAGSDHQYIGFHDLMHGSQRFTSS